MAIAESPEARLTRRWAVVRMGLGLAQMFGVTFSAVLLLLTGVNTASLLAVVLTAACTSISVLLFAPRRPTRKE